jgi:phage shock protein PspC (stress-responsive transcriptional regulator)
MCAGLTTKYGAAKASVTIHTIIILFFGTEES